MELRPGQIQRHEQRWYCMYASHLHQCSTNFFAKNSLERNRLHPNNMQRGQLALRHSRSQFHANERASDHDDIRSLFRRYRGNSSEEGRNFREIAPTCVHVSRILYVTEGEDVLEINALDWEAPRNTTGSDDQLLVAQWLVTALELDFLALEIDRGNLL